jgi:hypothetical protein
MATIDTVLKFYTEGIDQTKKEVGSLHKQIKKLKDPTTELAKALAEFPKGRFSQLTSASGQLNQLRDRFDGFFKVLGMPTKQWQKFNKEGMKFNTIGGKAANRLRMWSQGLRGFRMEMLSVMFFGMGMTNFFKGLLQPAMEAVGIFELWGATLQLVFLPVALMLLDVLLPLFTWLMNLSDETKLLIGKFVLFGAILGIALFLFGTAALAVGGIIMAFSGLWNILDKIIPDINIAGVNMSSFIEAGLGIGLMKTLWEGLKSVVGGLMDKFLGLDFVGSLLDKLGIKVTDNKSAWDILKEAFSKGISTITDKFGDITGENGVMFKFEDWLFRLQVMASLFWKQFKSKMDEVGINEFVTSVGKLATSLADIAPSLDTIATAIKGIASAIDTIIAKFNANPILHKIFSGDKMTLEEFRNKNTPDPHLPHQATGGYIPRDGMYNLHAGEQVTSSNENTFNINTNVNASSNVDIEMLKRQLSSQWANELSALSRR